MIRKDYLVRQFEEFGKVLATLLSLKKNQNFEAFEAEITNQLAKYSNNDINKLESSSLTDFEKNIILSQSISFIEKKIIAALLYEKMIYLFERNRDSESEDLKAKCLLIYTYLKNNQTENEFDLDLHFKLEQLLK